MEPEIEYFTANYWNERAAYEVNELANFIRARVIESEERAIALRKLLEVQDCLKRCELLEVNEE